MHPVSNLLPGFVDHQCEPLQRKILIPLRMEAFASKEVVTAACLVCGRTELERTVDRSSPAAKGFYMTV